MTKKFFLALCATLLPLLSHSQQEWVETPGAFAPGTTGGSVLCHTTQGDTIFYGGIFSSLGGESFWQWAQNAGIQPALGLPNLDDQVLCLTPLGADSLFVGGSFSGTATDTLFAAGIATKNGWRALDGPSGNTLSWNQFGTGAVYQASLWNDTVYFSGQFQIYDSLGILGSNQPVAKWHPATGILPLPTAPGVVWQMGPAVSEIVGDSLFIYNGLHLERISLVTGVWNSSIALFDPTSPVWIGFCSDMIAWGDTLVMTGSYYLPNEVLVLGYTKGQLMDLEQGQTDHASALGIDTVAGKLILSGLSLTGFCTAERNGSTWTSLGNSVSFYTWGALMHQGKKYSYGHVYFSSTNCPTPTHIALLSDTVCGPLTLPESDSVEIGEDLVSLPEPSAYPNPTAGPLTIELPEEWEGAQMLVFSLQGQKVYQQVTNDLRTKLDLSHLPVGVYLVRINTPHGHSHVERIVLHK